MLLVWHCRACTLNGHRRHQRQKMTSNVRPGCTSSAFETLPLPGRDRCASVLQSHRQSSADCRPVVSSASGWLSTRRAGKEEAKCRGGSASDCRLLPCPLRAGSRRVSEICRLAMQPFNVRYICSCITFHISL